MVLLCFPEVQLQSPQQQPRECVPGVLLIRMHWQFKFQKWSNHSKSFYADGWSTKPRWRWSCLPRVSSCKKLFFFFFKPHITISRQTSLSLNSAFLIFSFRLPNLGQTCYMNSVLQALLTLTPFVQEVHNQHHVWQSHPECKIIRCNTLSHTQNAPRRLTWEISV